jgi:hypothetical protein
MPKSIAGMLSRRPSRLVRRDPVGGWRRGGMVVASLAAVVVVSACGDPEPGEDEASARGVTLEHVHGLGVNPADDKLYVGSHHGLFALPTQGEPVAGRVQDFMGFTVVGPDHFLASGHPGPGQGGPGSLGLIESTDGGVTWESRSLAGEADFHALEFRHSTVYGLNSMTGEFMVSTDKTTWRTVSRIPMADFAVSPSADQVIVATTQEGLAVSGDGGQTFQLAEGAPLMVFVSWAEDGTLVGAEPDGAVQVSDDGGQTWDEVGELGGPPEALDAESGDVVYAAINGAVLSSTDGGRTFAPYAVQ